MFCSWSKCRNGITANVSAYFRLAYRSLVKAIADKANGWYLSTVKDGNAETARSTTPPKPNEICTVLCADRAIKMLSKYGFIISKESIGFRGVLDSINDSQVVLNFIPPDIKDEQAMIRLIQYYNDGSSKNLLDFFLVNTVEQIEDTLLRIVFINFHLKVIGNKSYVVQ